jgi:hypothetical protein
MNDRLYEIINQCFIGTTDGKLSELNTVKNVEKFAKALLQDCIVNLDFHGHEDAISQLRWHAQSKYGIILE